jgi:hypothetical protein
MPLLVHRCEADSFLRIFYPCKDPAEHILQQAIPPSRQQRLLFLRSLRVYDLPMRQDHCEISLTTSPLAYRRVLDGDRQELLYTPEALINRFVPQPCGVCTYMVHGQTIA